MEASVITSASYIYLIVCTGIRGKIVLKLWRIKNTVLGLSSSLWGWLKYSSPLLAGTESWGWSSSLFNISEEGVFKRQIFKRLKNNLKKVKKKVNQITWICDNLNTLCRKLLLGQKCHIYPMLSFFSFSVSVIHSAIGMSIGKHTGT